MTSHDDRELTTTLRLGSHPDASPTESALLESYLSAASGDEKAILEEILNGSHKKSMLIIFKGPAKGSRYLVNHEATIGRSQESEIFLDDVTVSRSHAVIEFDEQRSHFVITDRSSLNGTYINSSIVEKATLVHGDEVQIGKFHLLFISGQKQ